MLSVRTFFDEVDPRKIHKGAVPRLGGIAFFPCYIVLIADDVRSLPSVLSVLLDSVIQSSLTGLCFIACAVIMLYLVGMADDLIGLKYRAKFAAQILASALIVIGGVYMEDFHGFLWIYTIPLLVAFPLTILLTVFITNAVNLIDGIDGLASGLSAIACAFYGFIFFKAGLHIYAMAAFCHSGCADAVFLLQCVR